MLRLFGRDFRSFLDNLNLMHTRMGSMMPGMRPPVFTTTTDGDRILLKYESTRDGLAPMVVGLIEGVADKFCTTISIEHVNSRQESGHDEFLIRIVS